MEDEILTEFYISRTNNPHKMAVFKVEFLGEERINKIANKIKDSGLIPFAIEKCDKVYHLYFYGEFVWVKDVDRKIMFCSNDMTVKEAEDFMAVLASKGFDKISVETVPKYGVCIVVRY